MAKFIVQPCSKLEGEISIEGAKNGVLPIMAAALLVKEECKIDNVPNIKDVNIMTEILRSLGTKVKRSNNAMTMETAEIKTSEAPYEYVNQMRSSFDVMGPLLARTGVARVPMPGGCAIGTRPIDLHLKGFQALGATISDDHGYVEAKADKLVGADIYLDFPSVGATKNIMMAATLAEGTTYIRNAAREPEITDLAIFLNKMGANIKHAGTDNITIVGVKELHANNEVYSVLPDRIEAGTYLIMAGLVESDVTIKNAEEAALTSVIHKLREAGVDVTYSKDSNEGIRVRSTGKLKAVDITTLPFPGFPTDLQSQFMVLLTKADGNSTITETLFENRFMHVSELNRMGANIKIEGHNALIQGNKQLQGTSVKATDLRAGAALILAAIIADKETHIHDISHIDRGYDRIEEKLSAIGIEISRIVE